MSVSDADLERTAAAFRAGESIHRTLGANLYAHYCAAGAEDSEIVALAARGQDGARPMHLFSSAYYLLLGNPDDPLSRYYPTLTEQPLPPDGAWPEFIRYVREHRQEIVELLETRTVQSTYVERCGALMPALSAVAKESGEPLNLVEIGPSAGVLLAYDKYAYDVAGQGRIGLANSPVVVTPLIRGAPELHIPAIGTRTGIDLHPVDAKSEADRRWLLALVFPELSAHQRRLAATLEIVAQSNIRLLEGDALDLLPGVLAETPSPLCVYHSTCLMYWSAEGKAALDAMLREAGKQRDIYRVGIEPATHFDTWYSGRTDAPTKPQDIGAVTWGEVVITRYRGGGEDSRIAAYTSWDGGSLEWLA